MSHLSLTAIESNGWIRKSLCNRLICSIDLIPAVTTGINHRRSNFFLYARKLSKIAASILLAAFIGYGAGRISMSKSPEKLSLVVAETSYLVCLAPGSSTGLAESE